jgi:hypothetical protein
MTAIPTTTRASGLHGASMVLLGLAAALVVVDAALTVASGWLSRSPAQAITFALAMAAMVAAGAVLLRDRRHAGLGRLLLAVGASGSLFDVLGTVPDVGPAAFVQAPVYWLYAAFLIHLVLRWPDRRIDGRVARALVVAAYTVPLGLALLWQLTWSPPWWDGAPRTRWWITLVPARDVSATAYQVQQILFVALIVAAFAVVAVRTATARGERLLVLAPVAFVALVLGATVVVGVVDALGAGTGLDLDVLQNVALLAVPVWVLVSAARAPGSIDAAAVPGRRVHLDDAARERYRVGLAAVAAGVVVVIAVVVGASSGGWPDTPPAPQPGPALVAP